MNIMEILNLLFFPLDLRSATHEGIHAWYYKLGQKPMSGEDIGPKEEPATIVYLNGPPVKSHSKYLHYINRYFHYCQPWSEKLLGCSR